MEDIVLLETKLSQKNCEVVPEQCRHLLDEQKCNDTEFRYGPITGKFVIYRGATTTLKEAVEDATGGCNIPECGRVFEGIITRKRVFKKVNHYGKIHKWFTFLLQQPYSCTGTLFSDCYFWHNTLPARARVGYTCRLHP